MVTSSQVSVTAKDGIVTLRGSVPHYFEKSQAEEAAQSVGGVRAVADEIEVNHTER
jgi:osmotically-inducible protein OsmY